MTRWRIGLVLVIIVAIAALTGCYDDYWWWDPYHGDDGDYEGPEVERGERHLWSPGGWATKGWGFTRPESGVRSEPPRSRPPGTSISQPAEEPKKEEKKEEKKETTEERSLWRSGKKGE